MDGTSAKGIARRWILGIWNDGNLSLLEELATAEYSYDGPGQPALRGQAFRDLVVAARTAFPDLQNTIENQVAEGNTVVTRGEMRRTHRAMFAGIEATGRQIVVPWLIITDVHDGRVAHDWEMYDALGIVQQLGALPLAT